MAAINPDLVERFTGQRQIVTLAEAEAVLQHRGRVSPDTARRRPRASTVGYARFVRGRPG